MARRSLYPLTSGVDKFAGFAMHGLGPDRHDEQGFRQKIPLLKEPDLYVINRLFFGVPVGL